MEDDTIPTITSNPSVDLRNSSMHREDVMECPVCQSTDREYDYKKAEIVCRRCGFVLEEAIIDQGPEWRAYGTEDQNRIRTGAPATYTIHDKGLTTTISSINKDANGRSIPAKDLAQLNRMKSLQRKIRISGAGERNLALALSEIHRYSNILSLSKDIKEEACLIYRRAANKKLVRGRSIEGVAASSLYVACRCWEFPRTLDEIANASNVAKKEVGRTYRFLARELNIKLPITSPADYVPRFASKLGLSGEAEAKAIGIIQNAKENGFTSGKDPSGVAAAALYIASVLLGERKTQHEVADIAGVTEVTIRNRYKELSEQLGGDVIF